MNPKEYREFLEAYRNVYERQIGVPTNNPDATLRKIIKSDSKYGGGEVVPLKPTKTANVQNAHYEPEGDLVDEQQNQGPSTPVKIDTKMGVVPNQGATRVGGVRLKPGTPASSLIKTADSYEPEGELVEDIEERRKQLARASREGIEGFKERISARVKANRKRLAKKREREQLKSEIKSELTREAVGDPINPNSVYKLSDREVQKNLKSAMTPMGPPPMKTTQTKPQPQQKKKPLDLPTSFPF